MHAEARRANGPEAYRVYVEDAASPARNKGRRERRPAPPKQVGKARDIFLSWVFPTRL
jgi:hypothetical protein